MKRLYLYNLINGRDTAMYLDDAIHAKISQDIFSFSKLKPYLSQPQVANILLRLDASEHQAPSIEVTQKHFSTIEFGRC